MLRSPQHFLAEINRNDLVTGWEALDIQSGPNRNEKNLSAHVVKQCGFVRTSPQVGALAHVVQPGADIPNT